LREADGECRRGAYGLALGGIPGAQELLVEAPSQWDCLRVEHKRAEGPHHPAAAIVPLVPAGTLAVERGAMRCVFDMPDRPDDGALVHPYLAPAAAIAACWLGWLTFHAGAFAHGPGAWVVLGDPAAGKSTLLAALALRGTDVLADDLSCIRGGMVAAGPRCVDLREDAARHLDAGEPLGMVGARDRWRVPLAQVRAETPLRGWLQLAWGATVEVAAVPPTARIEALGRHLAVSDGSPDYEALLALAAAPMLTFRRPRDHASISAGTGALLAALDMV
jgi:hypothetical protein